MKKSTLALLLATSALAIPGKALAAEGDPSASCTPLKAIYAEKFWQDATPKNGRSVCRGASKKGARNTVDHFRLWRRYRLAAPYPGLNEGDKWLTWLAKPAYIVLCETRGHYGSGRWFARNASGAGGAYQLMPEWGAPYPATTPEAKVENHEIASSLSLSNWACA